jgi:hypothetical protein
VRFDADVARKIAVAVLVLAVVGWAGWLAAQYRPIQVTPREVPDAKKECETCGGTGVETQEEQCPTCKGSGRSEWKLDRDGRGGLGGATKPLCMACGGSGKIQKASDCSACEGRGYTLEMVTVHDVREGFSVWEQALQMLGRPADPNPRPYRYPFVGIYPMVVKYIKMNSRPGFEPDVTKCTLARKKGDTWFVSVVVEFGGGGDQSRRVYIRNRAVTGSDRLD